MAVFLCSDQAAWVTGQANVEAGWCPGAERRALRRPGQSGSSAVMRKIHDPNGAE